MNFGLAIESLKIGNRVRRTGWNGKGMWLVLCEFSDDQLYYGNESYSKLPWIGMKTADNCFVPWLASQTDVLAEDWEEVFSEPITFTDTDTVEIEECLTRCDNVITTCNNVMDRSDELKQKLNSVYGTQANNNTVSCQITEISQAEKDLQHEQTR